MSNYKEINISTNSINSGNDKRRSQIYRGISTVNPNTTNFNLYDADLIKQDLLNHFNIRKGEKYTMQILVQLSGAHFLSRLQSKHVILF